MNRFVVAFGVLPLCTAAIAQTAGNTPAEIRQPGPPSLTQPGTSAAPVVKPGGIDNGGTGSIGSVSRGPTGGETISNNSGADGNAEQNTKPVGNAGSLGGGGTN